MPSSGRPGAGRPVNTETEKTSMRSPSKAWVTACAVLTLGCLSSPGTAHAQFGIGLGGGLGGLPGVAAAWAPVVGLGRRGGRPGNRRVAR